MPTRKIVKTVEVEQELCPCGQWFDRYMRQIPAELDFLERRNDIFESGSLAGTTLTAPGECPNCWDKKIEARIHTLRNGRK
jgi:hypothetical protein